MSPKICLAFNKEEISKQMNNKWMSGRQRTDNLITGTLHTVCLPEVLNYIYNLYY